MGLKIAARRKDEKLRYQQGPVKIDAGPGCGLGREERRELKAERKADGKLEAVAEKPETTGENQEAAKQEEESGKRDKKKEKREKKEEGKGN